MEKLLQTKFLRKKLEIFDQTGYIFLVLSIRKNSEFLLPSIDKIYLSCFYRNELGGQDKSIKFCKHHYTAIYRDHPECIKNLEPKCRYQTIDIVRIVNSGKIKCLKFLLSRGINCILDDKH